MMSRTLGSFVDERASITEKALWHARSHTRLFLADALDETAKMLMENWFNTHDSSVFYLEFFNRYAIVFARHHTFTVLGHAEILVHVQWR